MEAPLAPLADQTGVLGKMFLDHPHALGETYWQHQRRALHFGSSMVSAGVACILHALVPALFVRTASRTVLRLHDEMQATSRFAGSAQDRSQRWGGTALGGYTSALRS